MRIAGYEIVRELHRGGQGIVYQAIQVSTNRKVAVKVMREGPSASPRLKERFEREVQILSQLKHPHIVSIYDSGVDGAELFYVMGYIHGRHLDAHVSSTDLSVQDTLHLFAKVCDAVNAAHLRGVIHRDLKPSNVLVDTSGEPHVLDFGLAKTVFGEAIFGPEAQVMTVTGEFVGTLHWASPEQAEGTPSKIDMRTDVYSLGVILYQLLCGRLPYPMEGGVRDRLDAILKADPIKPSTIRRQINDEVQTIILKCLSKQRERRYQTAGELTLQRKVGSS